MQNTVPYSRQSLDESDFQAVQAVLESDFLTQGPGVPIFEDAICSLTGAQYAVAVNSATSALHVALMAMGVGPGSIVWTAANSFAASANCALYVGAEVDFVDIDPVSFVITAETLEAKLSEAKKAPEVLIVVNFGGLSCDMEKIARICSQNSIKIVEDSSHATGATYRDQPVGSAQFSDISVFSFHPVKIITTGEGGVATTNNSELAERMRSLRTHGIVREGLSPEKQSAEPWIYEQRSLGYNYRLTDIAAALGMSQLKKLSASIEQRNLIADSYKRELTGGRLSWQEWNYQAMSSYHLFVVRFDSSNLRLQKYKELKESGFLVNVHYIPIYQHPYYRQNGFRDFSLKNTEKYYSEALSLPCYFNMPEWVVESVCEILKR